MTFQIVQIASLFKNQGCFPYKRQFKVDEILSIDVFSNTRNKYITDVVVMAEFFSAYIVTDTYELHEIQFLY
jgi:hypothetical protein